MRIFVFVCCRLKLLAVVHQIICHRQRLTALQCLSVYCYAMLANRFSDTWKSRVE